MHRLRPATPLPASHSVRGLRIRLGGRVQGVGFRPFVYRLARRLNVFGAVRNCGAEVEVMATASDEVLSAFVDALVSEAPTIARPQVLQCAPADVYHRQNFLIHDSANSSAIHAHLPPDYSICEACLAELHDPADRRYRYPFSNCTQCGPRYTLIASLPYDRSRTAMASFALCPACTAEYRDPGDRRFHAEPVACPVCGPQLIFSVPGYHVDQTAAALAAAVETLRRGEIVAVKGVGGYHLLCDARNHQAVQRLRVRKQRPHKPLAVLFPPRGTDGLDEVRLHCHVDADEARELLDPARPIVLLRRRAESELTCDLAPKLTELGCLLPYSPLHHLLATDFGAPLVATSANPSGEPVVTDVQEAERHLASVADAFLHHDRPILRPADDALVRSVAGTPRTLRLGRGMAPLEWHVNDAFPAPVLAVGGHMKNAIALGWEQRIVISPHIGDLDSPRSRGVFATVIADLQHIYAVAPAVCAHDAHPGYASTVWARDSGLRTISVPHHRAHAAAVAGEYPHEPRWLVFTWDGTGMGEDGSLWGGEALLGAPGAWQRVASLRPFALPGGDRAGRQPWRAAAALHWQAGQPWPAQTAEHALVHTAWSRQLNCPQSSSAGRLFDAAASVIGLADEVSFEGQAPMYLEAIAQPDAPPIALPWNLDPQGIWRCDWAPLLPMLCDSSESAALRAGRFHASLARAVCDITAQLRTRHREFAVGLSGGVFQNRLLARSVLAGLGELGCRAYLPARIPCNDGGLCFGQLIEARAVLARQRGAADSP